MGTGRSDKNPIQGPVGRGLGQPRAPRPSRAAPPRPWLPRDPCPAPLGREHPRLIGPSAAYPPAGRQAGASRGRAASRAPSRGPPGMDRQAAGARALGAAEPPRGPLLPSAREAPLSPEASFAPTDPSGQERETEKAMDRLASGAQSVPNGSPTHGEGTHSEEEGFVVDDEDSDGDLNTWELSEGVSDCPPKEQAADLFNEDWDLELKADQGNPYDADDIQGCISQEVKPWVCCAPQGDMIYDPSWHHPPPLIPHYSKMVFETGQFDDAED